MSTSRRAYINRIETAVPDREGHGEFIARLPELTGNRKLARKLAYLGRRSGITTRYTVLDQPFDQNGTQGFYSTRGLPSTGQRMAIYRREAPRLATRAAAPALAGMDPRRVTHLIVTTCTGFYAPGIDIDLLHALGLSECVCRTIIGFMGCYSAFPGLRLAQSAVLANPDAVVLVVSVELCSIHFQNAVTAEQWMPFLIFADGASAAIVSSKPDGIALGDFHTCIESQRADAMTWDIGNEGYTMTLSPKLPDYVAQIVKRRKTEMLAGATADKRLWAIHPGGKAILDAVEKELRLPSAALANSREVLRRHGNMSSPTVMFVLKRFLDDPQAAGPGCAMAFGPGLAVECCFFEKLAARPPHGPAAH
ncbi:MAG: type III polyketide synthase [Verrucomicrobia bacterium]|nr:type III polyketide synthase [Verrucomicrobiota bacterium]